MADFDHRVEISLRYRDLDPMNHVNNAVYATFLEQARTAYFREVLDARLDEEDVVIADIELAFERPVTMAADAVTVETRVPSLGTSSFPVEYRIHSAGERKATGSTTVVCYDPERETSRPIPRVWRKKIAAHEELEDA